jgi:small subunit ribosomal protein S15
VLLVAILSERVNYLTDHLAANRKDKNAKRTFASLLHQRKQMLKYLRRRNVEAYYKILKDLNIREVF